MNYTFTPAENADAELLGKHQAALAKLKPACVRCRRNLSKRELASRHCSNREDCRLRQIFAGSRTVRGQSLKLSEVHELQRFAARKAKS